MFISLRRVHIAVSDFARSRRFYGETLGLPEIGGFERDWVEFGLGPVVLNVTPLRAGEVPSRNQVAIILSVQEIDGVLTTLKERGVTVTRGPADEFTGRYAEILDPDGYRIIVYQAGELHPEEEWVQVSRVDELVKARLDEARQREKARAAKAASRAPAPRPAPRPKPKPAARKPARPAPKSKPKPAHKPAPKPAHKAPPRPAAKPRPGAKPRPKPAAKKPAQKKK